MSIGIFGGSFNPLHIGHYLVCQYVLAVTDISNIWIVPVKEHPFGKPIVDYWHRYEMCAIIARMDPRIDAMSFDNKFTIDLVEELVEKWPHYKFSLIVGSDIQGEWTDWKNYEKIQELVPIVVVNRSGYVTQGEGLISKAKQSGQIVMPNVNSTEIRKRLSDGLDVDGLIPKKVLEYIRHNNLEF